MGRAWAAVVGGLVVGALVTSSVAVLLGATPAAAQIDPPAPLADWGHPDGVPNWIVATDGIAFDPQGDLWTLEIWYQDGYDEYAVERDPASGTILRKWPWDIYHGAFLEVDPSGNLWTFVPGRGEFTVYSPSGALLRTGTLASVVPNPSGDNGTQPRGYAFDGNGDLWTLGGTLEYESRVFHHNAAGQVIGSWPRPQNVDQIEIGPDGTVHLTTGRPGTGAPVVQRYSPSGDLLNEFEIGHPTGIGAIDWEGVYAVVGLAVDGDGTVLVAGPVADAQGERLDDTLISAYAPSGELLTRWGPAGLDESRGVAGDSVLAADRSGSGGIAVVGEEDLAYQNHHVWTFGAPDACAVPAVSAAEVTSPAIAPTAASAAAPPQVGLWRFEGCWQQTSPTTWRADGQIKANGLLLTPDAGAFLTLDSQAHTLVSTGPVTVATGSMALPGGTLPSIVLGHGSLSWPLGLPISLPVGVGLHLIGLPVVNSLLSLTPGPQPGEVSVGPIELTLPDLIGGTASVTLAFNMSGARPESFKIGPLSRLLGGLLPVENLTLEVAPAGWSVLGRTVIPGTAATTFSGSMAYNQRGERTAAAIAFGDLELFGGTLPVNGFSLSWSQAQGWRGQATAPVLGEPSSSVAVGLRYEDDVLTSGTFFASRVAFGSVAKVNNLDLGYALAPVPASEAAGPRVPLWWGNGSVELGGPADATVEATFVLRAGQLITAAIDVKNLNLPLGPAVSLTRLGASINTDPWRIGGTFGFGAGPTIEGRPAVRINAAGSYTYPTQAAPGVYRVDADVQLTDFTLVSGSLEYLDSGRLNFGGRLGSAGGFSFPGVRLDATVSGWVDGTAGYAAEGAASIGVNGLALTGRAVVSSTGIAACGGARVGWTWETGIGYQWVGNKLSVMGGSCDLGPFTTPRPTAAGTSAGPEAGSVGSFTVAAGEPVHAVRFTGTDAPPLVRLAGPSGQSYTTPTDPDDLGVQDNYVVVQDRRARTTTFLLNAPNGGTWTAFAQSGSSTVTQTEGATGLPEPQVSASVTGSGAARTLNWSLTPLPGQVVTFVEKGPGAAAVIATTSNASGQIAFTPADGPAGPRQIVAVVQQDGVPRDEITVGSYTAPSIVTVSVARNGTGSVTSSPSGITCGTVCSLTVAPGTPVTLTATGAPGSPFAGWSGPCDGTGTCTFTPTASSTATASFGTPPSAPAITAPTRELQKRTNLTIGWGGGTDADGTGAVVGRDVRYRRAALDGVFAIPVTWQTATTATSAPFTADPGATYCFSTRAVDADGLTSAWSFERCLATPLDDRALSAAGGFVRRTATGTFAGTYSEARSAGATLTRTGVTARRIGVLVERCHGCGRLQVRHAGQLLGTIDLEAAATKRRVLVTFTETAVATGALTLTTVGARPVRVDAIVVHPL